MAKQLEFDEAARAKLLRGIAKLTKAVRGTLGPRGHKAILASSFGTPRASEDTAEIARALQFDDPIENMAAQLIAAKTTGLVDGTATATVLTQEIYRNALTCIVNGANPNAVRRGIEKACDAAVQHVSRMTQPIKTEDALRRFITRAADNDEAAAAILTEAFLSVGKEGSVFIEKGDSRETTLSVECGIAFDRGYLSPHFITDARTYSAVLKDCYVAIIDATCSTVKPLIPLLERVSQANTPLVIIAHNVESEALATLVVNRLRGILQVCAVKAPGFGDARKEMLIDIAIATGGEVITPSDLAVKESRTLLKINANEGISKSTLSDFNRTLQERLREAGCEFTQSSDASHRDVFEMLGRSRLAIIRSEETVLVVADSDAMRDRCNALRLLTATAENEYEIDRLNKRATSLASGVACISVGAATDHEIERQLAILEDALDRTRTALREGVVPGGGVAFLRAKGAIDGLNLIGDEQLGAIVLRDALESPMRTIIENSGIDSSVIIEAVRDLPSSNGYDVESGKYVDMLASGIVDAAFVVRSSMESAVSVACLLLTSEVLISDGRIVTEASDANH